MQSRQANDYLTQAYLTVRKLNVLYIPVCANVTFFGVVLVDPGTRYDILVIKGPFFSILITRVYKPRTKKLSKPNGLTAKTLQDQLASYYYAQQHAATGRPMSSSMPSLTAHFPANPPLPQQQQQQQYGALPARPPVSRT